MPCTRVTDEYFIGHGGLTDSCPTKLCYDETVCSTGEYRAGCGGVVNGFCTPCTDKNVTEYFVGDGGLRDACPKAPCANIECAAGSSRTGSCGNDITRSNNNFVCELCTPGTFNDQMNATTCTSCAAGTYQAEQNSTACEICTPGYYCAEGSAAPLPCPGGTHANLSLTVMTSIHDCVICPVGTFCSVGSAEPIECAPGTYNDQLNASTCANCAPGTFQAATGSTACEACTVGSYCAERSAAPLPCPGGTHANLSLTVMTSIHDCVICPVGTFCSVGSAEPIECAPGTYNDQLNASTCANCAPGTFQAATGSTACEACTVGSYCAERSAAPLPCPGGTHVDSALSVMTSAGQCITCSAGKSCSVGSTAARPCLPGSVSNSSAMETCTLCPDGEFQRAYGQTACAACVPGFYCKQGSAEPTPCPAGRYGNATGLYSAGQCTPVPIDFWAPLGSRVPEPCPVTGFFCPGALRDSLNGGSKPILMPVGQSTRQEEAPAVTKIMTLDISIDDFAAQSEPLTVQLATRYGVSASLVTLVAAAGSLQLTLTIATTDGRGTSVDMATLQQSLDSVNDAALATAIADVVGMIVSVVSQPAVVSTVRVIVPFACPPGFWCTAGLTVACEVGFFNPASDANNQSACIQCPEHATTIGLNATHLLDCICEPGYYNHRLNGVECLRCPVGTRCDTPGSTLGRLWVRPGYYRPSNASIDVRVCADSSANCGDDVVCPNSTSGCAGGNDPSTQCQPGLESHFCTSCANRSRDALYYVSASEEGPAACAACPQAVIAAVTAITGVALIALALLASFLRVTWRRVWRARWRRVQQWWEVLGLGVKVKQMISFFQVSSKVGKQYHVTMPPEVRSVLGVFEVAISFGLDISTPLECIGAVQYEQQLIFWMSLPLVLISMLLLAGLLRSRLSPHAALRWALPSIVRLMFLLYAIVNAKAFEAFPCHDFGDADGRWLVADVNVRCESAEHTRIKAVAWVAICLYPIGWTATTAALLFVAREPITGRAEPTDLSRALRFVYGEFEPGYYWWELLEMLRRFLLVGLLSIVSPGSISQLMSAAVFCVLYLAVQVHAGPYKNPKDNFLALCASVSLACLFLSCIVLKLKTLVETEEVREVLSPKLRELFDVPMIYLSTAMLLSILSSLALSGAITLEQVRANVARQRRSARLAIARRLRHVKSGVEVQTPALAMEHFHVFLSHTWNQGDEVMRVVKQRLLEMMPDAKVFLDKDNLRTGAGAEYVDVSSSVLVFCSEKYLSSRACARELFRAVLRGKPLIAVIEPDDWRGGLSPAAIKTRLATALYPPHNKADAVADRSWSEQWGLDGEVTSWGYTAAPTGGEISEALFAHDPIEWNRFSAFQDVTMRLIAERLLSAQCRNATYVQDEIGSESLSTPRLSHGRAFHLYFSPHNAGADRLAVELGEAILRQRNGAAPKREASKHFPRELSSAIPRSRRSSASPPDGLRTTSSLHHLDQCEHMLIYLTSATWTRGDESEAFARDVCEAMREGVHLLLVHEFPSALDADQLRGACAFNEFWNDDWTPKHLLSGPTNIYKEIANHLMPGAWRMAGLASVVKKMEGGGGPRVKLTPTVQPAPRTSTNAPDIQVDTPSPRALPPPAAASKEVVLRQSSVAPIWRAASRSGSWTTLAKAVKSEREASQSRKLRRSHLHAGSKKPLREGPGRTRLGTETV